MGFQSPMPERDIELKDEWPVLRFPPSGERRARLILLSSGKSRDLTGSEPDAGLFRAVVEALTPYGVECINPRLPLREDGLSDTDEELVNLRADLAAQALLPEQKCSTALLAVSLGTLSAMELAARTGSARCLDALVLVGCVLERPIAPVGRIGSIDLVYGARDHVGYLHPGDGEIRDIEGPQEYGPKTQRHIVTGPGMTSTMQILAGAGHALEQRLSRSSEFDAAMTLLTPLLLARLGLSAPAVNEPDENEEL